MSQERELAMRKLPQMSGLVLCDRIEVDPSKGEYSYVGVFNVLRLPFPKRTSKKTPKKNYPLRPFSVCGTLFNGEGEGVLELTVENLALEERIDSYQRWVSYQAGMLFYLEIHLSKCAFKDPGRHQITLSLDNNLLAQRYLDVFNQLSGG
jgi:hypothetical protein